MKKESKKLVLVIVILAFISNLTAAVTNIYESITIYEGDSYGVLQVYQSTDVPPVQTVVDMYGGQSNAIYAFDDSMINIYDGTLTTLEINDSSIANLYGGTFSEVATAVSATAVLNIYGYDFDIEIDEGGPNVILSGYWLDGTEFSLLFRRTGSLPEQVNLLPEPTSLLLLGISSIALRLHNC